jgi:hypothetical protein
MLLRHIALVPESPNVPMGEAAKVAAALQKQVMRDLAPLWDLQATVDSFARLEDMPLGYWPIVILDDIGEPGAAGIHKDDAGQPLALVQFDHGWSLTASHEAIEMLVDPWGNRLAEGQSPKEGQQRVEFLVEPCDPGEDARFSYVIDGVMVSDFYTPGYFSTMEKPGERYSYTGAIKHPRQVLANGYLSWREPTGGQWWQETCWGGNKAFRNLGLLDANSGKSPRRQIYDMTKQAFLVRQPAEPQVHSAAAVMAARQRGTESKASTLRRRVDEIRAEYIRNA